ncbi:MAG: DsbA family protein [Rhodospirillaceae bacterium]|nr:DsbA family protein [Rhodospirillaceae bacterium]
MARIVDFYYAIGSRYCYLAQSQVQRLEAIGQVAVRWRPLLSEDLMRARGLTPFKDQAVSVQYMPEYRSEDAARWAAFYNIPYREPSWKAIDWRRVNMAAVVAARVGDVAAYSRRLFDATFGAGATLLTDHDLARLAGEAGLDGARLVSLIDDKETQALHRRTIDAAVEAGAFGVPTFVVDGEVFWGNDRLILLQHHLAKDAA